MAKAHAHVPLHVSGYQDIPPSPTLTNPDMILPFFEERESYPPLPPRPLSTTNQSDILSHSSYDGMSPSNRPRSGSKAEVGIATAVTLPMLVKGPLPTTIAVTPTAMSYYGYEHGAPLSDIGEEAEEIMVKSRSPSPLQMENLSKQTPLLRHKQRLSNLSTSSGGSDRNEQSDTFDTSRLISDRVAADIAQARDAANNNDDSGSNRNSREVEEELAILNDRAEKILANARKRLSSMEDNLTKARHSILLSPRSIPNMHDLGHQPAGGLYRSISQNAQNRRSRGLFPSLKTMGLQHARTGSESASTTSGLKRLSSQPEPRSASAMDFSPARYGVGFITSEVKPSPPTKFMNHSPSSSRSYNSPLRVLAEEGEAETPSTVTTSPDILIPSNTSFQQTRGLGIHSSGTKAQEDLTQINSESSESSSLHRSSSQASTKSVRDLKDQMSEMKNRIADLKQKAQVDTLRRRSIQNLRTPSPFLNSNVNGHGAEGWYTGSGPSNSEEHSTTPSPQPSNPTRTPPRRGHQRKDSALESVGDQPPPPQVVHDRSGLEPEHNPMTPVAARLPTVTDGTPFLPTSARTDRNTPNLVNRTVDVYQRVESGKESPVQGHNDGVIDRDYYTSEDDDVQIASNEEEQVYLNEVLEESLHDLEPEVPRIPGQYLIGDDLAELRDDEAERHEDRLDAFDYENMFLHSAMGTYRGDESEESDDDSLVTSREDVRTPTAGLDYEDEDDEMDDEQTISGEEQSVEDESGTRIMQAIRVKQPSSPRSPRGPATSVQQLGWLPVSTSSQGRSPLKERVNQGLPSPSQPWSNIGRTKSIETVSSVASFQTAAEGEDELEDEDEDFHDEILNWGNAPSHHANHGQTQHLPSNGISDKARNVLGWPTPSATSNVPRHSSYIRPQQVNIVNSHSRSTSAGNAHSITARSPLSNISYNGYPFPASAPVQPPPNQPLPPPPPQTPVAAVTHQANTEILMESLIKLADPEFSIGSTGRSNFADIDKDLVLGLLRAVGEVCDGVLRAQHGRRGNVVKDLRERLINAKEVLIGVTEQEGLEETTEDDDDDEYDK